jgi:hypothetical protein
VAAAIERSHREDAVIDIPGTPFGLFVSLQSVQDGNAVLDLVATAPLGGGCVPADTFVYGAVLASQLATAPMIWRHVMRHFLTAAAIAPPFRSFNAPGPMPHAVPWLCGFLTAEGEGVTPDEWDTLCTIVQQTGLILLQKCEQACQEAAMAGNAPELDLKRYPELQGRLFPFGPNKPFYDEHG